MNGIWFVRHALKNQYKNIKYNSIGSKALLCLESSLVSQKKEFREASSKGFLQKAIIIPWIFKKYFWVTVLFKV